MVCIVDGVILQQHWSADWKLTQTPTWRKFDLTLINWSRYLTFHI